MSFRRPLLTIALLGASLLTTAQAESDSLLKDATKGAVSNAISAGKNLLGGVSDGITEGREGTEGVDGALSISTFEQFEQQQGQVEVLSIKQDGGRLVAALGLKNTSDKPIRLINLQSANALLAIDEDGYSSALVVGTDNPFELTIPPQAGIRQRFVFETPEAPITAIRIWGRDLTPKR